MVVKSELVSNAVAKQSLDFAGHGAAVLMGLFGLGGDAVCCHGLYPTKPHSALA